MSTEPTESNDRTPPRLAFHLPLDASRLLRARERFSDYLRQYGLDEETIECMELAVDEACTNVLRHSMATDDMEVVAFFNGPDLVVDVRDHGRGFDTSAFDPRALPDPLAPGGRGLYLMARLTDEMVLRELEGIEVHLVKREARPVPPTAGGGERQMGEPRFVGAGETHEKRLRVLLDEMDEAFYALDWEYRYVFVNDLAQRMFGKTLEEVLGRTPFEVWPELGGTVYENLMKEAMELGRQAIVERLSPVTGDWLETRVYPTPTGVSVYLREINERKRTEEERERLIAELQARSHEVTSQREQLRAQSEELRLRGRDLEARDEALKLQTADLERRARFGDSLDDVNLLIHSTVPLDDVIQRVLEQGVNALDADVGAIEMLEDDEWVVRYQSGLSPTDVGVRLSDGEAPFAVRAKSLRSAFATTGLFRDSAVDVGFVRSRGFSSVLGAPLTAKNEVVGVLLFCRRGSRRFDDAELGFARRLGALVSLALDNARLDERHTALSTTLERVFARPLPEIPGLEIARANGGVAVAELAGGDFSDVFALDDTRVAVLIGDAAGRGVQAVGMGEIVHTAVASFALIEAEPSFILRMTNELLLKSGGLGERFATAFLLLLDVSSGEVRYARAGHPAPVVVTESSCGLLESPPGLPLGAMPCDYTAGRLALEAGDCVVLYTDGVTEARRGGDLFGADRLIEALHRVPDRHPQVIVEYVTDTAVQFAGRLQDDAQVLALRLTGYR